MHTKVHDLVGPKYVVCFLVMALMQNLKVIIHIVPWKIYLFTLGLIFQSWWFGITFMFFLTDFGSDIINTLTLHALQEWAHKLLNEMYQLLICTDHRCWCCELNFVVLFGTHGSSNQLIREYTSVSNDHSVCFQLPFEVATYWMQHTLILIIVPFFLVSCQGMLY